MLMFLLELVRGLFFAGFVKSASFPKPLSAAEERQAVTELLAGSESARDKLIMHNLRLCAHIANKYAARGKLSRRRELDDLISIGTIGLIKAVDSFAPDKGSLSSYASRCIENEIRMSLRTEKKLVGEVSMEEPLGRDREGNERTVLDLVGTDGEEIFEEVRRNLEGEQLRTLMDRALKKREKLVLSLRCGLDGATPMTQQQVADRIGISRSYISRIEKKAVLKLRLALLETGDLL
ncbi:MAG: RNA polymerase sporulation sigma factor SigK [Clostridia bacterium]|nr:RNA polymerase sporulation sigma factor SigK [Clostridia bacterium]MBR0357099.1 RNA polymerase sporulation sigma factor SigK [Clostridia bacterium]